MKHSKLPWMMSKCALHPSHYDILSPQRLVTCVKGDNKTDAAFIVTACNAHDTLKAKADLFDEFVHHYQPMWSHLAHYIRTFENQYTKSVSVKTMWASYDKIGELMEQAKELTK